MSLINQMLQELEQRKATDAPLIMQSMHQVRAVAMSAPKRRLLPVAALTMVLMLVFGWSLLPKPLMVGFSKSFSLLGSATIINDANAQATPLIDTPAPVPTKLQLSFAPILDKQLPMLPAPEDALTPVVSPAESRRPRHVALLKPASEVVSAEFAVQQGDALASEIEVQSSLTLLPEPLKQANQLAFLPKPIDKNVVNKQLSPAQLAAHDYYQAITYLQQGRVAESMDLLRKVLSDSPAHDDARQTLVGLLVDNRHHDEAIEVLQMGLKQSLAQPALAQTLARLQLEAGHMVAALNTLEASMPYAKLQADYLALTAVVLQRLDRQQEAIAYYQHALSLGGQTPAWLVGLGVALQTEGRTAEAKKAYQQAQRANLTPELAQFVDQRLKQVSQTN